MAVNRTFAGVSVEIAARLAESHSGLPCVKNGQLRPTNSRLASEHGSFMKEP